MIDITARLLAGVASRDEALLRELLPTALPWVRFLLRFASHLVDQTRRHRPSQAD